ncbi:MAG: hypothetical protein U0667_17225 [Chloroflexota bacterium]
MSLHEPSRLVTCPVCLGVGGYTRDGIPASLSTEPNAVRCHYCRGERRVELPDHLYDGPPMLGGHP